MFKYDNVVFQFLITVADLVIVSVLWFLCCMGVVTFGASCTSAYYCVAKCIRYKTGYIHREFFKCFKENFKQSTIITVIFLAFAALMYFDFIYIWHHLNNLMVTLFMILVIVCVFVISVMIFAFPLLSRFDNGPGRTIKNAAAINMRYLYVGIYHVLLLAAAVAAIIAAPILLLLVPGIFIFILTYSMEWIMRKFMPKAEEGSEEALMWYNDRKLR